MPVPVGSQVLEAIAFSALLRGSLGGVSVRWVAGALIVPLHHPTRADGWLVGVLLFLFPWSSPFVG